MNSRIIYIKSKRRQGCHSHMFNKVNNFKIFRIFNEKSIFLFCESCKGLHNTFMVKVGIFDVYFKIMPFWVTSWFFKKVLYNIALTCICNTWLLYYGKPYGIRRVTWCSYAKNYVNTNIQELKVQHYSQYSQ